MVNHQLPCWAQHVQRHSPLVLQQQPLLLPAGSAQQQAVARLSPVHLCHSHPHSQAPLLLLLVLPELLLLLCWRLVSASPLVSAS
jgi:hypothetical protein